MGWKSKRIFHLTFSVMIVIKALSNERPEKSGIFEEEK